MAIVRCWHCDKESDYEDASGYCENCGKPIGKARLEAFPRATMCVSCKQRQERR